MFIFSQVYDIIIRSWKNYKAGDTVSKHKPEKPSGIKKFEDITSSSKPSGVKGTLSFWYKYKFKPFFLRDHKRNLKVTVSIIGCFAVLLVLCVALYANNLFGMMKPEGYTGDENATFVEDEDVSYKSMYDITDADSLKDLLRSWATNNGEKLSSKNVINVLLIGEDDDNGSHRSDTMILVSLNKKTKKITLTSFLRDSYTYMNINGSERFDKINHSYGWGGTDALIQTLENNYKVEIDHYVTINFESFVAAIDAIGGVRVPVTEAEARYMNRTTRYNDFESGDSVLLDGKHALVFSRIRKLDGEAERTDRQKLVISALIRQTKSASLGQLDNLLDTLLPYISTNYSRREIITLGTQALTQGWMDYEIVAMTQPLEEFRAEANINTWSHPNLFVWIVDYPLAAQALQNALYGTTNIQIDNLNHQSALDMLVVSPTYDSGNDYNNEDDTDYYEDYEESTTSIIDWRPSITIPDIFGNEDDTSTDFWGSSDYTDETETSEDESDSTEETDTTDYEEPSTEVDSDEGTTADNSEDMIYWS